MNRSQTGILLQILVPLLLGLIIYTAYTLSILPQANIELQLAQQAGEPAPRSWAVLLKDPEQGICLFIFFWAMFMIWTRFDETRRQSQLLMHRYIPREGNEAITPESAEKYYKALQNLEDPAEREAVLPQMLMTSLNHYNGTRDISSATSVAHHVGELKADHMESELSMLRYIAWAIPSVGFIGTVRGIGAAMSKAGEALNGDITGVTEALGVAFNSTYVALFLSVFLMLGMHWLQKRQDKLLQDCNEYCNKHLLSHLGT